MSESEGTLCVETSASRVVVGRVFRGESLRDALHRVVNEHALRTAWVTAIGAFEWIDLTEYKQTERRYAEAHRFERCELLAMHGNLSLLEGEPFWHLHATVSVRENGRDVTYGGHVDDGVVFALEFRIECFDAIELQRAEDSATGLHLWSDVEAKPGVPAAPEPATGANAWAMLAEISAQTEPEAEVPDPKQGDWLEHEKFGICKIERLSGDGVCIIKLADATRKKIKLDVVQVLQPRQEAGRRVFPVRSKRKG